MSEKRHIEDLLDFHFHADLFEQRAENLSMLSEVKSCIKRLSDLSSQLDSYPVSEEDMNRSFLKEFKEAYENGSLFSMNLTSHQLRFLSYNLPVDDYDFLVYVLATLQRSFCPSMISGFLHSLLCNWRKWQPEEKTLIIDCMKKMRVFEMSFYKGIDSYLSESGPYRLGLKVRRDGQAFVKACSVLRLSSSSLSYQYFSDAIYAFYKDMPFEKLSSLVDVLKRHNKRYTSLLVLSNQIVRYKERYGYLSDHLFHLGMDMIGNPEVNVNWAIPDDFSDEKRSMVTSARKIILAKINERFIRTFFECLCEDAARRDFWVNHSERIISLKVFGSSSSRFRLRNVIGEDLLVNHFNTLTGNNETCALVMQAESYVIIEFTDVGALYVYQKGSRQYEQIFSTEIRRISDLKISTLPNLVEYYYSYFFNDEGRMIHTGHWQQRLERWIEIKLH